MNASAIPLIAGRRVLPCLLSLLFVACGDDHPAAPSAPAVSQPPSIQLILFGGQSNAGKGGFDATRESRELFPNVKQFAGDAKSGLGWVMQTEQDFTALEAAHDDMLGGGQYIATTAGLAMGRYGGDYIVRTDWYGGRPIEFFVKGTVHFNNTQQAVRAARSLSGDRPVVCPWYVWIHGESGPYDRALYANQLRNYIASIVPAIEEGLGQGFAPTFVIVQTNNGDVRGQGIENYDYAAGDSVGLAQWDVARTTPNVILAGPMYQAPIIRDAMDNIHLSSIGRMVVGEMLAAVKEAGADWKPLQPRRARLVRDDIFIRFDVPAGGLAWDTSWIAPAPNFGFSYDDDDHSAVIKDVTIIAKNLVRIALSNVPTGEHKTIRYAQGEADFNLDGWPGARGQLICPTERVSLFWSLGHPVPRTINHYSIKFEMPLEEN